MMKNRDPKNLSLPLSSVNLPATVSGINRNSPSRASIKAVLPPVIPSANNDDATFNATAKFKHSGPVRQMNQSEQPVTVHSTNSQLYYDVNNYLSLKPSMQQIPEQSTILMFNTYADEPHTFEAERVSPSSVNDQFKYRYSSSSLDSGRGSDSIKLTTGQSNRVSVHSCESIGSSSSNKESEASQQSSSLSSSSSTSSSFCSSSSSSSSSSYQNPYYNRNLSSSISSNIDLITPIGDCPTASNSNVFSKNKSVNSSMISNMLSRKSNSDVGNIQSLVAQAGPPSIAEMILHGIPDPEIIHNWLKKIKMSLYEKNFIDAAYDMATITRITPQDLTAIGITDPKIRSILTAEIQKLNVPENLPSYKPDSLEEWLKIINMYCYYGSLCQQGYTTIDKVTELTWEDLEDVGINKLGHQKKILLAIKKIKSCKSKSTNFDATENKTNCAPISPVKSDEIYSNKMRLFANSANVNNASNVEPPSIMTNNSYQLPYQDVAIKMYANNNLNSPTNSEATTFEACSFVAPNNIVPSSLFITKPQMRTFQQASSDNGRPILPNSNNLSDDQSDNIYGASQNHHNSYSVSNATLASRGRSLESLNNPNISNYCLNNEQQYYNPQYYNYYPNPPLNKPTYQYSNGDLYNDTYRQTICCEQTNPLMNTFSGNQVAMSNYEIDGTATLNRPKNLIKNKPVAKIVASSRQQDIYDGYDSASLKSNDSNKFCQSSDSGSDTGSIYSTLKKKPPPPPPKRVNSIYKPNSLPSTPLSSPFDLSNQIYSNTNFYDEVNSYNALNTEDLFASCVKNLTSKFSEMHSLSSNEEDSVKSAQTGPLTAPNYSNNVAHSNTLPMNKKEFNLIESNVNENVYNISSSSSTESMPFANDNIGTIRQKSSNFMLNALKFSDTSSKPSSSSSSSSSTSSPMYNRNLSLPNSAINSPSSSAVNCFQPHQSFESLSNNLENSANNNNNSSRQNVVESLEDIEIMLANLKTQLDSIE